MGWQLPPVALRPRAALCMQTAGGEMHLALNGSGDEAPLPSGVPHPTLPTLFNSCASAPVRNLAAGQRTKWTARL